MLHCVAGLSPQAWASALFILPLWKLSLGAVMWLGHVASSERLELGFESPDLSPVWTFEVRDTLGAYASELDVL